MKAQFKIFTYETAGCVSMGFKGIFCAYAIRTKNLTNWPNYADNASVRIFVIKIHGSLDKSNPHYSDYLFESKKVWDEFGPSQRNHLCVYIVFLRLITYIL